MAHSARTIPQSRSAWFSHFPPAATAVLAGETQLVFGSVAASLQHVKTGRLRALAVTGLKRSSLAPELPTLDESGFPGYNVTAWHSFVAPTGTTPEQLAEIIRTESAMWAKVIKEAKIRAD